MLDHSEFPNAPYKSGFWLVGAILFTLLVTYLVGLFVHNQEEGQWLFFTFLFLAVGLAVAGWANSLVRRSGWKSNRAVAILAPLFFIFSIIGGYAGYDVIFSPLFKLLNVTKTVAGSPDEFYVVFITWTAIVTGVTGSGVGLALGKPKLAAQLLITGILSGGIVFYLATLVLGWAGFTVGSPRADGLASMPIVTIGGLCLAALLGSEVFGRLLVRERET